jgi:thiamine biosynthesis lipoprotein
MLRHRYRFEAFGTQWSIDTADELSSTLKENIAARIEAFDKVYSRFRTDSLVTSIAEKAGTYMFPEDARTLFNFYRYLYTTTEGKVTPLIGDALSRAGYDANYSFQTRPQQSVVRWDEVMQWNGTELTTTQPVLLDVGAAGKGYAVDIIGAILNTYSIQDYVIDASGDLRHRGTSENKVGLEHPLDSTKVIGVVDVVNKSLCASASNRRSWGEGMHHIFDPDTVKPVQDVIATWVLADEAMVADGIATALFFSDPSAMEETYEYEYVRVFADGTVSYSPYFEGKLF